MGFSPDIRYLLEPFFADFCCREGISGLICFVTIFLDRAKGINMYEIKSRRLHSQILTFFFQYYFQKNNHGFVKIATLQKKCHSCIDIGNLEDSPRLVFIDQECGKLIVVNDSAELTMNINQKKKPDVFQ